MLQIFIKDHVAFKKKKFGSAICIITESELWMYILFYCYIRCIFQEFQIEIF